MSQIVLVADDSMTIQRMALEMLTERGLEVVTVANGVAAIKKLATVRPVLVLADVDMPGRDGYEVCDFVKRSAELGNIPVILSFSDADPFDQERVTAVRADAVVKKPFHKPDLFACVEEFIGKEAAGQTISSESGSTAGVPVPKPQEQIHISAEFSFSEHPAQQANFAGIPEGAGLFEPEFPAEASAETTPAPLLEAVPTLRTQAPVPKLEDSEHAGKSEETVFSAFEQTTHQTVLAKEEPGTTEFRFQPLAPALAESLPSFVGVGFTSGELKSSLAMPVPPASIPSAEESLSIFMANASAEIAGTFVKPERANPVAPAAVQQKRDDPPPVGMPAIPPTESLVELAPETASKEFSSGGRATTSASPPTVEDTDSRLGDWKLPETAQLEQCYAGIGEPVLAVVPDLKAELYGSPAQPEEEVEQEVADPRQTVEEFQPGAEATVEPQTQVTEPAVGPISDALVTSPELQPAVSSNAKPETSIVKEEKPWVESPAFVFHEMESPFVSETPAVQVEEEVKSWPELRTPVSNKVSAYRAPVLPEEKGETWAGPPAVASSELPPTFHPEAAAVHVEEHESWAEPGAPVANGALSPGVQGAASEHSLENPPPEDSLEVMQPQLQSVFQLEQSALKMEDRASSEMPQTTRGAEVVEQSAAETEPESFPTLAPQVSTGNAEELTTSHMPAADVSSGVTREARQDEAEDNKSWEVPSEAALNEAFLEAALSSIGLLHAKQSSETVDQLVESPAGPNEVLDQFEAHSTPSSYRAQRTEPAAVIDANVAHTVYLRLVESIVQRVVVRMSPSALSPEMMEQVIKKLTGECLEDLESDRL